MSSTDLHDSLFARARGHYDTACRISWAVILGLAILHLTSFAPYLELRREQADIEAETERARRRQNIVEPLREEFARIAALPDAVDLSFRLTRLVAQFAQVNAAIHDLRRLGPDAAADLRGEAVLAAQLGPDMAAQEPISHAIGRPPPIPTMDAELRRGIAEAEHRDALLERIAPYVASGITKPLFREIQAEWSGRAVPQLRSAVLSIEAGLDRAVRELPEEAATWDEIRKQARAAFEAGVEAEFTPPKDRFWWATAQDKDVAFEETRRQMREEIEPGLLGSAQVDELRRLAVVSLKRQRELADEIALRLEDLETSFEKQQSELASLVTPLDTTPFNLTVTSIRFPLLLGLALAALLVWKALRLRELVATVRLLSRHGYGDLAEQWLALSGPAPGRVVPWGPIAQVLVFGAWIAYAAAQLARDPDAGDLPIAATTQAIIGALAVLLAALLHVAALRMTPGSAPAASRPAPPPS